MKKIFKGFILFPLICILIVLGVVLQLFSGIQKTMLDSEHFEKFVLHANIGEKVYESLSSLVNNAQEYIHVDFGNGEVYNDTSDLENMKEEQIDFIQSIKDQTLRSLNKAYFEEDIPRIMINMHHYYFNDASELPTINILPIKELVFELIVQDLKIELGEDAYQEATIFIKEIKTLQKNGFNRQELLKQLMLHSFVVENDLTKENVGDFIDVVVSDINSETKVILDTYIRASLSKRVELNRISDQLDLEEYFFRVYSSNVNPVSEFPMLIRKIKAYVTAILIVTMLMFIIIMYLVCGKIVTFSKWLGITTILSGAVVLITSVVIKLFDVSFIKNQLLNQLAPHMGTDMDGVISLMSSYLMSVVSLMIVISAVVTLVGICLVIASIYDQSEEQKNEASNGTLFVRIAYALICVVIIPVHIGFQGLLITRTSNQFEYMVDQMSITSEQRREILFEVTHATLLFEEYKKISELEE